MNGELWVFGRGQPSSRHEGAGTRGKGSLSDGQSVKLRRGFDAGKVGLAVDSADIQQREGAPDLLKTLRQRWLWLQHVFVR